MIIAVTAISLSIGKVTQHQLVDDDIRSNGLDGFELRRRPDLAKFDLL